MGKRQDWPITVPFLDRRSRRGRRDVGDCMAHSLGEEAEKVRGASCALPYPFLVP
jgi:hypothetical protein